MNHAVQSTNELWIFSCSPLMYKEHWHYLNLLLSTDHVISESSASHRDLGLFLWFFPGGKQAREVFVQDCLAGAVFKDVYMIHQMSPLGILTTTNSTILQWSHNGRDGVSNQQPHDCLLNRLFRRRSKKISKLRVTGLCVGNSPVRRKMFPFNGVIMRNVHVIG